MRRAGHELDLARSQEDLPDGNGRRPVPARGQDRRDLEEDVLEQEDRSPLPDGDVLVTGGYSDRNENTDGIWRYHEP